MNLEIEPNNVDVNIHPTKHEVHFLYEDEIIEQIRQAFEIELVGSNETRDLYTQCLLPGASDPMENDDDNEKVKEAKVYAKDMIRSDSKEQKLEKFFGQCVIKSTSMLSQAMSSQSSQPMASQSTSFPADTSIDKSFNCTDMDNASDNSPSTSQTPVLLSTIRVANSERKYKNPQFQIL